MRVIGAVSVVLIEGSFSCGLVLNAWTGVVDKAEAEDDDERLSLRG